MSNRILRVNELVQRELSDILRKRYQTEAVAITITGVEISPDLHDGKVFVAITGDAEQTTEYLRWLRNKAKDIRFELGRRIVLKFTPLLTYTLDETTARGNRVLELLDDIGTKEGRAPAEDEKGSA